MKKILRIILLGISVSFFMVGCSATKSSETPTHNIQMAGLQKYIDKGALFIDVREYKEMPKFKLPNLVQIPTSELKDRLAEIPHEGYVVIFCRSGRRSSATINYLTAEQEYTNLLNVLGGAVAISTVYPEYVK